MTDARGIERGTIQGEWQTLTLGVQAQKEREACETRRCDRQERLTGAADMAGADDTTR